MIKMGRSICNRTRGGNERGATFVEAALALPFLILFSLVAFDLLRISFQALSVQYLAVGIMRQIEVGTITPNDIVNRLTASAKSAGVDLAKNGTVELCPVENYPGKCTGTQARTAGALMVLNVELQFDSYLLSALTLLSKNKIRYSAQVLGKIEPD